MHMSEINVAPFVDVMLVLVIIFMITAPLVTIGVPVDLPDAEAKPINEEVEPLVVTIDKDGRIFLQEAETEIGALVPRLVAVSESNPELRIYVRGDQAITYGQVMKVIGLVNGAGFTKVALIAAEAEKHDCALRVGVNCGSVDPDKIGLFPQDDSISPMIASAFEHCQMLDELGFTRYCVSLKDSDPDKVIAANTRFAKDRPDVPLHLGVTEAGMPPDGIIKTRIAFEQLISAGIGDTIRVSLTLPFDDKGEEIAVGRQILDDIQSGRFRSIPKVLSGGLNIISCPSCSRVENEAFIDLAHKVREVTAYARRHQITIAIMGCRVNGPGETDDADLGLWCAPNFVNLKRGPELLGQFPYDEVLVVLKDEVDQLIAAN